MSATILDIARQCGVSPGIVDRVLSDSREEIGEETRDKIRAAAKELGYEASHRTHNLGVLFMDESAKGLTHPFFAAILNAFKIAAEARGYDVTFINHRIGGSVMTYREYCQLIPCVTVDHIYKRVPAVHHLFKFPEFFLSIAFSE